MWCVQVCKCRGNYCWDLYLPLDTQHASFQTWYLLSVPGTLDCFALYISFQHRGQRSCPPGVSLCGPAWAACPLFLGTVSPPSNKLSFQWQPLHLLASPYRANKIYMLKHCPTSVLQTPPLNVWGTWRPTSKSPASSSLASIRSCTVWSGHTTWASC